MEVSVYSNAILYSGVCEGKLNKVLGGKCQNAALESFMVPLSQDRNLMKCNIMCRDRSGSGSACFFVLWVEVPETKFQPCSGSDTTLKYFQVVLVVLVGVDQIITSQQGLLQQIQNKYKTITQCITAFAMTATVTLTEKITIYIMYGHMMTPKP